VSPLNCHRVSQDHPQYSRGRGLKGRDYLWKGGSYPRHHAGDKIVDLSQMVRPDLF
jgi:hypothetical protein